MAGKLLTLNIFSHTFKQRWKSSLNWCSASTSSFSRCLHQVYRLMVFNSTFNNISIISWWSVLLVEETGVPAENHQPVASNWPTLSHNVVSSTPCHERGSNSEGIAQVVVIPNHDHDTKFDIFSVNYFAKKTGNPMIRGKLSSLFQTKIFYGTSILM